MDSFFVSIFQYEPREIVRHLKIAFKVSFVGWCGYHGDENI